MRPAQILIVLVVALAMPPRVARALELDLWAATSGQDEPGGGTSWLTLRGSASYARRLGAPVRLSGGRDLLLGRPGTRSLDFALDGDLVAIDPRLTLDAGLELQHDLHTGPAQVARLSLAWHF